MLNTSNEQKDCFGVLSSFGLAQTLLRTEEQTGFVQKSF
jgi:hypothetical protein